MAFCLRINYTRDEENKEKNKEVATMTELKEVERLEITAIMDNYADWLLPDGPHVKRAVGSKDGHILRIPLMAEHSLCLRIRYFINDESHDILLDVAENKVSLANNLNILDVDLQKVEAIIVSHGHEDHTDALPWAITQVREDIPVIIHPDAFLTDKTTIDNGVRISNVSPKRATITNHHNPLIESKSPYLSPDGHYLVTGEIPRLTSFEQPPQGATLVRDGKTEKDLILDDQAIVFSLKGKGIVVISGCAHSGIINTVSYAQQLSKQDTVFSIIGGFHLPPSQKSSVTMQTIEALKTINPNIIIPMHCTGFYSISSIQQIFKERCVISCVGSTFLIQ